MRSRGKKVGIECEKFQMLGEISALTHLVAELEENDHSIPSEKVFIMIYQCYDQLMEFAKTRELALRFTQLKQNKRVNSISISYLSGAIAKCKQALASMKCFS